jgi:hypothetical protein
MSSKAPSWFGHGVFCPVHKEIVVLGREYAEGHRLKRDAGDVRDIIKAIMARETAAGNEYFIHGWGPLRLRNLVTCFDHGFNLAVEAAKIARRRTAIPR